MSGSSESVTVPEARRTAANPDASASSTWLRRRRSNCAPVRPPRATSSRRSKTAAAGRSTRCRALPSPPTSRRCGPRRTRRSQTRFRRSLRAEVQILGSADLVLIANLRVFVLENVESHERVRQGAVRRKHECRQRGDRGRQECAAVVAPSRTSGVWSSRRSSPFDRPPLSSYEVSSSLN